MSNVAQSLCANPWKIYVCICLVELDESQTLQSNFLTFLCCAHVHSIHILRLKHSLSCELAAPLFERCTQCFKLQHNRGALNILRAAASHAFLCFVQKKPSSLFVFREWSFFKSNISYPPDKRINSWWAFIFSTGLFSSCSNMPSVKKDICSPALLLFTTAEGRAVNLLQPFFLLPWHGPLCQC